ncbi:MAG: hypothetical protein F6K41_04285 [Symploca sp. SIO3E6]|nr:hypothetical protein [Caldora sp. SIO3E6]
MLALLKEVQTTETEEKSTVLATLTKFWNFLNKPLFEGWELDSEFSEIMRLSLQQLTL